MSASVRKRATCVLFVLVAFAVLAAVAPVVAAAGTIYVDVARGSDAATNDGSFGRPYRSIRKALTEAVSGDEVNVAAGEYSLASGEIFPLTIPTGVTVQGDRTPVPGAEGLKGTSLMGDGAHSIFRISPGNENTIVDGFFFEGPAIPINGGAIEIYGGTAPGGGPIVSDCVFVGLRAASGGAIYINRQAAVVCAPRIERCFFIGCAATAGSGGAINALNADVTVTGGYFIGCSSQASGGALALAGTGQSTIRECTVGGCGANANGGGIWAFDHDVRIRETQIIECYATYGGGVYSYDHVPPFDTALMLENCTVMYNDADNSGAGVYEDTVRADVRNCTIVSNSAAVGGGGLSGWAGSFLVGNSILWGNVDDLSTVNGTTLNLGFSCFENIADTGTAIIHDDPMLAMTGLLMRLKPGSPCIDTGINAIAPTIDCEGRPRLADGDGDRTATADMGASERSPYADRAAGSDRYATAVAASRAHFDVADNVILATGVAYPDALCAAPLAGCMYGPVLLTKPNELPSVVAAELERLQVEKVYIVGGTSAVSDDVAETLRDAGYQFERLGGSDRYATGRIIAEKVASLEGTDLSDFVLIARGDAFPDALSASPLAYRRQYPILLTKPGELPSATSGAIAALGFTDALVVGGESAVSSAVYGQLDTMLTGTIDRVSGADRYATSAAFAQWVDANRPGLYEGAFAGLATGANFPDALCGGAACGSAYGPLLLTRGSDLPDPAADYITDKGDTIAHVEAFGGTGVVADAVLTEVRGLFP